jgi:predicted acetyltransferase
LPDEAWLRLRPVRLTDEPAVLAAQAALATEYFPFALAYQDGMPWADYVEGLERHRRGVDLRGRYVPSTFLLAEVAGEIVGRVSIRHELNDFLAHEGGHIGYCVLAEHRRRGYASQILRQSLVIASSVGVDRVLLTCDDHNIGSATVIQRAGGVYENTVEDTEDGVPKHRYWINLT